MLKDKPDAKIAVLYQNDDFGKDFLKGFRDGLGDKAAEMIVARGELRGHRPHRRFADHRRCKARRGRTSSSTSRRRSSPRRRSARPTTSAGSRCSSSTIRRPRSASSCGRPGIESVQGHHLGGLRQGPDRSAVRATIPAFRTGCVDEEVLSRRQPRGSAERVGLHAGPGDGAGAEAVRRRSDARERHAPGRQPEGLPSCRCCSRASTINTSPTDYQPMEEMLLQRFNGERFEVFGELLSARQNE